MTKRGIRIFVQVVITVVATLLLSELLIRVYYAYRLGPRILLYGTPAHRQDFHDPELDRAIHLEGEQHELDQPKEFPSVEDHSKKEAGYTKYFPNEKKVHQDVESGEYFPVTINAHGFRGDEFSTEKPDGVIRVVTLGASSTFGFYNRDHETYPAQLERALNEQCDTQQFEVINLAIPHSTSDKIRAIFRHEGLKLKPDIVSFYEGRNDTNHINKLWKRREGILLHPAPKPDAGISRRIAERSLLARNIQFLLDARQENDISIALEELDAIAGVAGRKFLHNVSAIADLCDREGIRFIPMTQQANSKSWYGAKEETRLRLKGVSMAEEARAIEERMHFGEPINAFEELFLVHVRMQDDLRDWALDRGLGLVDIIDILDQRRHLLLSWVHLHRDANRIVAEALAEEILEHSCQGVAPAG